MAGPSVLLDLAGRGVDRLSASVTGRAVDRILDRHRGAGTDAGHLGDLADLGRPELLQRAEVLDQRPPAYLTEAGDVVEHALHHRLGTTRPVVRDGEPVRLVAHPLQEVEALGGPGEDHRV